MSIIMTVDNNTFIEQFKAYNRLGNFSYKALNILFEYLEELTDDTGENFEMDVIGLCCDYTEDDYLNIISNYSIDTGDAEEDELFEVVKEYLQDNTILIGETENLSLLYQAF